MGRASLPGIAIGFVGELHPKWRQTYDLSTAPVMFELELEQLLRRPVPEFKPVSRHQPVQRDIAVLVPERTTHAELIAAIWAAPSAGLLRDAALFDIYRPKAGSDGAAVATTQPAEKSLAVRLTLNSDDATLTDAQIDNAVQAILEQLSAATGARQRT